MTARQRAAVSLRNNADNGSLLLVTVIGWLLAEFGLEPPPGISDAIAGYIVLIGTKIRGAV